MLVDTADLARGPACHGYACGCACARCCDRSERSAIMRRAGLPNAASEAQRQSADYFTRPWRYRDDPAGDPPQPLHAVPAGATRPGQNT